MYTLYNPTLLNKSYETTRVMQYKINSMMNFVFPGTHVPFITLNNTENYQADGLLIDTKLEMKQRQNFSIQNAYLTGQFFKDTTIQKSSTAHDSETFIIYDQSLRYIQVYVRFDIEEKTFFRMDNTEYGLEYAKETPIALSFIPTEKTLFLDTESPQDMMKLFFFFKEKLGKDKTLSRIK